MTGQKTVLHVLPHPGGGGETYVDSLSAVEGYRSERMFLAGGPDPRGAVASIAANGLAARRRARRYDLLHVHGEVAAAICLPAVALRPSVVTLHGLNLVRRVSGARRTAAELNLRLLVRAATRTICVTQAEYDELIAAAGRGAARRLEVIHNGVPLPEPVTEGRRAAARAALALPDDAVTGVWLGGLDEHKDPRTAAAAAVATAAAGARLVLLVAGDGPLRSELEETAGRDGGGAVRVLGFRADVGTLLEAADFFVLSSLHEGLSYALLEAMAMGLPPVVSDPPGNVEAVGAAGLVVPCGDVDGFAAAFARLATDATARLALGSAARERVAERFHVDRMVRRTGELYDTVLRRAG